MTRKNCKESQESFKTVWRCSDGMDILFLVVIGSAVGSRVSVVSTISCISIGGNQWSRVVGTIVWGGIIPTIVLSRCKGEHGSQENESEL